jgi:hypothetical membrane protein
MKSAAKKNGFSYTSLAGITAPLLFTTMTLVCSTLRPGYDHLNQFISELGATGSSHADLMNFAGFIPSGLLMAIFGVALLKLLPRNILTRIGAALIILFGVGVIIAGSFSCDPGCPQRGGSFENSIHDGISGPAFLSATTGILLFGISFRTLSVWKGLWIYSLVSALLSYGFIMLLVSSLDSRVLTGLWQRLLLATIFLWCGIVAIKIFNSESRPDQSGR